MKYCSISIGCLCCYVKSTLCSNLDLSNVSKEYLITNLNHSAYHGHHLACDGSNVVYTVMSTTKARAANQVKSIGRGQGEVHSGAVGVAHYGNQKCFLI